jgi:hypothetical protein
VRKRTIPISARSTAIAIEEKATAKMGFIRFKAGIFKGTPPWVSTIAETLTSSQRRTAI